MGKILVPYVSGNFSSSPSILRENRTLTRVPVPKLYDRLFCKRSLYNNIKKSNVYNGNNLSSINGYEKKLPLKIPEDIVSLFRCIDTFLLRQWSSDASLSTKHKPSKITCWPVVTDVSIRLGFCCKHPCRRPIPRGIIYHLWFWMMGNLPLTHIDTTPVMI